MKKRQIQLTKANRIVIKIGSSVLADPEGGLKDKPFRSLAPAFVRLMQEKNVQLVLVSSGAIAFGMKKLGFKRRPPAISDLQACAASGQASLVQAYEKAFSAKNLHTAQILLTQEDLQNRHRYLNTKHTIHALLERGVVPIVNENDTVSVDEIKVGDNDTLSALVASLVEADMLIMLTDCDGLHTGDPRHDPEAKRISVVEDIDVKTESVAKGASWETRVGGMLTKLSAARIAGRSGIATVIADGNDPKSPMKILSGKDVGTLFLPSKKGLRARKHWIGFTLKAAGQLVLDKGAVTAIVKGRKSLLATGIKKVNGNFRIGDPVDLITARGRILARGLTAYSAAELEKIKGCKSNEIETILGYRYADEVIHQDDMTILDET